MLTMLLAALSMACMAQAPVAQPTPTQAPTTPPGGAGKNAPGTAGQNPPGSLAPSPSAPNQPGQVASPTVVAGTGPVLPHTRVPPTVVEIRTGRPLADEQSVGWTVGNVGESDA